ncbi:hypothetical protein ABT142_12200 [Streptomyces sp. NPDC001857]|uniref:hypothetical protein n=1 Tax=unclassified Streptomyces TaxID=2593676 RepID=UPI00332DD38A
MRVAPGSAHRGRALDGCRHEGREALGPVGAHPLSTQRVGEQPLPVLERLDGGEEGRRDLVGLRFLDGDGRHRTARAEAAVAP